MKKRFNYIFTCILAFSISFLSAQSQKAGISRAIDSLLTLMKTAKEDTVKIRILNELAKLYSNKGNNQQELQRAKENLLKAENTGDKKSMVVAYIKIGGICLNEGDYEAALQNFINSLKLSEELGLKKGIANSYNNIGLIYLEQENYEMAQGYFLKSLKIKKEVMDKKGMANSYTNIGSVYLKQRNYEKALENKMTGLKLMQEIGDKYGIEGSFNEIGNVYEEQMNLKKALESYTLSLKIGEEMIDKYGIARAYYNIGSIYMKQNKLEESDHYLNFSLLLYKEVGTKAEVKETYAALSKLYEKKGDFKQSLYFHKLYSDLKDTLLNDRSNNQIAEMNAKYNSEKNEKDIQLLTKDNALQQSEAKQQKFIRNCSIAGFMLAMLLAFVLYNRFKVSSRQKKIIESQNFQIVESINYSKKIQNSLLPDIGRMRKAIPNLFVFYEPKAIVSGDFYWFHEFEKYTILACADCTGHGVPGGFMSTLGSLLLDKIGNTETLSPSEILKKLSDEIIRVLHQEDGGDIQDGMDLSICLIDRSNNKIEFSGARNGIIIVTDGQSKKYKADPLPVGGNYMKKGIAIERNFKTQSISINSNDWIYMYTDGFMEQIGEIGNVPMTYSQFEEQLIDVSKEKNPEEKNKLLQRELDNWRGIHERDDDILIIGFQVI